MLTQLKLNCGTLVLFLITWCIISMASNTLSMSGFCSKYNNATSRKDVSKQNTA